LALEKARTLWHNWNMTDTFRVRIERKLIQQATKVAEEIGTTPGDVVRLLFRQMVKRRTIPFPLQADTPESEVFSSPARRSKLWDQMNEGKPSAR
jgi:addiction module RelB/DinJ family antitoxin